MLGLVVTGASPPATGAAVEPAVERLYVLDCGDGVAGDVALVTRRERGQSNWDARRVPSINADKERTAASMDRLAKVIGDRHAQLWINHDHAQSERLRHAPDAAERQIAGRLDLR